MICPKCKSITTCCQSAVDRQAIANDLARLVDRQSSLITKLKKELDEARMVQFHGR